MRKVQDITGQRFTRLVVIERRGTATRKNGRQSAWLCRCDCGVEKVIPRYDLTTGNTKSCGCMRAENSATRVRTHGRSGTTEHKAWVSMKIRCEQPGSHSYARYGAKGIRICDRWANDFRAFLDDMGPKPSPTHEVDRIDNSKGYEPGNCRWATREEQMNNRTNSRFITFDGKTMTLAQWAKEIGVRRGTLAARIDVLGWSIERALSTHVQSE